VVVPVSYDNIQRIVGVRVVMTTPPTTIVCGVRNASHIARYVFEFEGSYQTGVDIAKHRTIPIASGLKAYFMYVQLLPCTS